MISKCCLGVLRVQPGRVAGGALCSSGIAPCANQSSRQCFNSSGGLPEIPCEAMLCGQISWAVWTPNFPVFCSRQLLSRPWVVAHAQAQLPVVSKTHCGGVLAVCALLDLGILNTVWCDEGVCW